MKAVWNGEVIAQSDAVVVVEGNHYFPLASAHREFLRESEHTTRCHWKGRASYFHVVVGGETNENAAWYYGDPKPAASELAERVAFWHGVQVID